jgi:hypothetical protein
MRARPEIAAATGLAERMFDKCVMSAQVLSNRPPVFAQTLNGG